MRTRSLTRRDALDRLAAIVAGRPAVAPVAQTGRGGGPGPAGGSATRPVPRADLVNTLEFEEQAGRHLSPAQLALVAGSERASFDRITLHPRMCVPVLDMDLSLSVFGETHFAPIIVGPIENQRRFHADGELATVKGAAAAKATAVLSSHSSVPLADLTAEARTPLWYQVFASDPAAGSRIRSAIQAGCRVVCVTVGASPAGGRGAATAAPTARDWSAVGTIARMSTVPVIVKGVATLSMVAQAIAHGAQGVIVSSYTGSTGRIPEAPMLRLGEFVAAAGRMPVLVDGSFRRGTDILKALAFGARAVLIGRPIMWGLAAYGADGVQGVVEMLQTELARYMGMCGKARLAELDRTIVRVHGRAGTR